MTKAGQNSRQEIPLEIALEEAEFFRALSPARMERVRPCLRERRFSRQRLLLLEGEAVRPRILDGAALRRREARGGREGT